MMSRFLGARTRVKVAIAVAVVLIVWLVFVGALGGCGSGSGGIAYAGIEDDPSALYFGYGELESGIAVADEAPGPQELGGSDDDPVPEPLSVDWWNWGSEQDFCTDNAPYAIYDCIADPARWGWGG